jgi:putative transcriptional regulator
MPAFPCAGRLLVAAPALGDPNFVRSVVLLLEHNEQGSLGVILNRPTDLSVADVLDAWSALASEPDVVFQGGPVGLDGALALAALGDRARVGPPDRAEPPGWRQVYGDLGLVDLDAEPAALAARLGSLRIFAGYAGWGPGQLEVELAQDAWYVVDSEPGDAFSPQPERLWGDVLRRQPGDIAFVATRPVDPTLN